MMDLGFRKTSKTYFTGLENLGSFTDINKHQTLHLTTVLPKPNSKLNETKPKPALTLGILVSLLRLGASKLNLSINSN